MSTTNWTIGVSKKRKTRNTAPLAGSDQSKRRNKIQLDPDGAWEVVICSKAQKNVKTVLLDSKRINRKNKINTYLGAKFVPITKLTIRPFKKDAFWTSATSHMKKWTECAINVNDKNQYDNDDIAVAFNNGIVVGGFLFYLTDTDLKIVYLCSSKMVPNIGSVLIYAAEEFARMYGKKRLSLVSIENAKPFYFKVGLDYDSNTSGSEMYSYNGYEDKKKLHFPTRTGHRMRKYVTSRRSETNSNATSRFR